ncbi:uncharacterized protein H6S33_001829 [Morchella sextelata]|uniref:uncharacterized protein n=1 Tax=Morchella sextelata TaxID=1174677 RepID=UPI001D059B11|nr:uncharacterized protein H6S33_001829 [Morchella sextelata]KAH0608695.1 hypothetical protein H6S33_001829 [Morchella sextelata]
MSTLKRKRASKPSGPEASPPVATGSTTAPELKKPRKTTKGKAPVVKTDIPWPGHFKELEKVHRALNVVFTFCCTRKHLATTFDNLKSAVEGNTKKELVVEDIAQIKFLLPKSIQFIYVDEEILQIHVMAASASMDTRRGRATAAAEDVYEDLGKKDRTKHTKEVLLFEFIDGDLKKTATKGGKSKEDDFKMPTFSMPQMTKLINKRNKKFTAAVNTFLAECAESGVDAVESIKAQYHPHVPVQTKSPVGLTAASDLPLEIPKERKSIAEIIEEIKVSDLYSDQIVPNGHRIFPPQEAIFGDLTFQLSQDLVNALYTAHNITKLYSHQAEAINNLHDGHHVIVSTSTSSGKSLIYQVPVLHELEKDPETRAMFIFPTKALAQDQRRSLIEVLGYMRDALGNIRVETFDGDTNMEDRRAIRNEASVIFTNPDMLHLSILPNEEQWRTFLKNLKFVVVDELHVYNGIFGSHIAFIMRRLRRICSALGNNKIKFVSCSATVANPEAHMRKIFGIDTVKLTEEDGSPAGRKEFLCWNTPYKDANDPSEGRVDPISESAKLFSQLILRGVRAIAFCRTRNICEGLLAAVKSELQRLERPEVVGMVMAYRGGYSPQDRRMIEKEMFEGRLMGIIATSALELGVDIGSLDAVVTVGFPYSISNLRQQSGRAGRRNKDSLSILVGDSFPTDQYYMTNPDEIFTKPNVQLQVDLENILVREGHIQCAAFEMPIKPAEDTIYFGADLPSIADERLLPGALGFYHCHPRFLPYPSKLVAIRDTEDGHIAVVDITARRNHVLEEVEPSRAMFSLYDGAIFLHQGRTYLVKDVSWERKLAQVELVHVDWTTSPRDFTDIDPIETEAIRQLPESPSRAYYGAICIRSVVFGYFKMDKCKRILDAVEVDTPPLVLYSKGMWLDIPRAALDLLGKRGINVAGAIHAAQHAILSLLPGIVVSMPGDVRTECKVPEKEFMKRESARKRPGRLVFYDAKGGKDGSGISTKAFEFIDVLLKQAWERVKKCGCGAGCVECVTSERCKESNAVMSKTGAYIIISTLLNLELNLPEISLEEQETCHAGVETVVFAEEYG